MLNCIISQSNLSFKKQNRPTKSRDSSRPHNIFSLPALHFKLLAAVKLANWDKEFGPQVE